MGRKEGGNFNPRSPRGERRCSRSFGCRRQEFQSTLPARGATHGAVDVLADHAISIHAPREGSDVDIGILMHPVIITIHAPREGSDMLTTAQKTPKSYFNPRSPRGERLPFIIFIISQKQFQSTLPARGATRSRAFLRLSRAISIHAPREGSDFIICIVCLLTNLFQSTLPARGATRRYSYRISSRAGFQSTLPARGATGCGGGWGEKRGISIHAPREGSDIIAFWAIQYPGNFNPRSPRGERPSAIS